MPTYCYILPDDTQVERYYPVGRAPKRIRVAGRSAVRASFHAGSGGGHLPACWPMYSFAAAVHPSELGNQMAKDAAAGVPTEYKRVNGGMAWPKFVDRSHRKRYFAAHGFHDKDAGYGDRAPK